MTTFVRSAGRAELHAGWRIIVAALLGTAMGLPTLPFYTVGIFGRAFDRYAGYSQILTVCSGLLILAAILLLSLGRYPQEARS